MILGVLCEQTMRLESITQNVQTIRVNGTLDREIQSIAYDSRQVRPGALFVALRGMRHDGSDYIREAVSRGAIAVVSEEEWPPIPGVTQIRVEKPRRALAEIASAFFDNPSAEMDLVGITGTNGKTTVSFMCKALLEAAGRRTGLMGTVQYEIGRRVIPAVRTTPEALDIQRMLREMLQERCSGAVMEVSSHALAQRRVWGIDFDVAVFTNLSQDHLDYHESMDRYFQAKALLFRGLGQMRKDAAAVINIDDSWGQQLARMGGAWTQELTFGEHPAAAVRAVDIETGPFGCRFGVVTPWGEGRIDLPLLGRFNVSNALAAIAACAAFDHDLERMCKVLSTFRRVPGRMEEITHPNGFRVFVDYAHTPDALAKALETLRGIAAKRVITVFGCGGNRDVDKRALMGSVASRASDMVYLTSDNPRSEDPMAIMAQIEEGLLPGTRYEKIEQREEAIAAAIREAERGDVVLVAGKGHETYQEFAHTIVPFDDRDTVRKWLAARL